jgi:DNA-binding NarL/FixJ family response regulator
MASKIAERIEISPRQKLILKHVFDGLTNKEIAEKLKISHRTVEVHRFNLMKRLDAHNSAQLIRKSIKYNLIKM